MKSVIKEGLFETSNKLTEYEKLVVNAVVSFIKDEWKIDAKIVVRKVSNTGFIGDVRINSNAIDNNIFSLNVAPNTSFRMLIKTLIHELTHIKQIYKKELKPSAKYDALIWKDKFEIGVKEYNKLMKSTKTLSGFNKYNELPWEVEAINNTNDEDLFNKFIQSHHWLSLKGRNETIDFIINNI